MHRKTVNIVSYGCSKNLVDSERLAAMFDSIGYDVLFDSDDMHCDVCVINTCGFIGDAKEESINGIVDVLRHKLQGHIGRVYVMGCLTQRYRQDIAEGFPEIDAIYGKFDWAQIIDELRSKTKSANDEKGKTSYRLQSTPRHHAYLKISEGCNRFCAFCAIPYITGRFHSRSIEELVAEATELAHNGVTELNVIAQELTSYGIDLYGTQRLADLMDALASIDGIKRIRLHYAYPTDFPTDILDAMNRHPNICKYLDIALQHASDNMLVAMKRHITLEETRRLLDTIREKVPGIHIRTTLMVGFPGETEEDFKQLVEFVKEQRFERMGAFSYSAEEGTYAGDHLTDDVDEDTKKQRLDTIMMLQQEISEEIQQSKCGKEFEVVIDEVNPDNPNRGVGRTEYDSPEVDPVVYVTSDKPLEVGKYYKVLISEASEFDLVGHVV